MPIPVQTVLLPRDLRPEQIDQHSVVVFDVLRATTSITMALAAGVIEIRIFPDAPTAQSMSLLTTPRPLLSGEVNALPPPGFDLGNSPRAYNRTDHAGRTIFLATTNGTKAIIAAQAAASVLIGSLANANAVANQLAGIGLPVTLLCSGSSGRFSLEDSLGCGAVLSGLLPHGFTPDGDASHMVLDLYSTAKDRLAELMEKTTAARNLHNAHLDEDVDFCARLNTTDVVGRVLLNPLRVVASDAG